jgi:oligopeptide/dipeptide ABC transporter ATP-binding protein
VMVTRDLSIVAHYCHRIAVMYGGVVVELCDIDTFFQRGVHPYSLALLRAAFAARGDSMNLTMTGSPPNLITMTPGCQAHPRCPLAQDICRSEVPQLDQISPGHWVRCHRKHEIA